MSSARDTATLVLSIAIVGMLLPIYFAAAFTEPLWNPRMRDG